MIINRQTDYTERKIHRFRTESSNKNSVISNMVFDTFFHFVPMYNYILRWCLSWISDWYPKKKLITAIKKEFPHSLSSISSVVSEKIVLHISLCSTIGVWHLVPMSEWVSDQVIFVNSIWAIFQLYHSENKLILAKSWCLLCNK